MGWAIVTVRLVSRSVRSANGNCGCGATLQSLSHGPRKVSPDYSFEKFEDKDKRTIEQHVAQLVRQHRDVS